MVIDNKSSLIIIFSLFFLSIEIFDDDIFKLNYLIYDLFIVLLGYIFGNSIKNEPNFKNIKIFLSNYLSQILIAVFFYFIISIFLKSNLHHSILRTGALGTIGLSNFYLMKNQINNFGMQSLTNIFFSTWFLSTILQNIVFIYVLKVFFKKELLLKFFSVLSFFIFISLYLYEYTVNYFSFFSKFWQFYLGYWCYQNKKKLKVNDLLLLILLLLLLFIPKNIGLINTPLFSLILAFILLNQNDFRLTFNKKINEYFEKYFISLVLILLPFNKVFNLYSIPFGFLFDLIIIFFCVLSLILLRNFFLKIINLASFNYSFYSIILLNIILSTVMIGYSYKNKSFDDFYQYFYSEYDFKSCKIDEFKKNVSKCKFIIDHRNSSLYFIGNSHSDMLLPIMNDLKLDGYQIISLYKSGLFSKSLTENKNSINSKETIEIIDFLKSNAKEGDKVILSSRILPYFEKDLQDYPRLSFYKGELITKLESLNIFKKDLIDFVKQMKKKKIDVIYILPFPEFFSTPNKCFSPILYNLKIEYEKKECETSSEFQYQRRKNSYNAIMSIVNKFDNFITVDPINLFCNDIRCSPFINGRSYFRDNDHVNYNSKLILKKLLNESINK
tara:strand:+ start:1083 stop:2918 length:1836 start_codon:yes stop_codon:yes gene_type:complete